MPQDADSSDVLAIDGGPKVREDPFPPRRLFGDDEKQAVMALFDQAAEQGSHILGYHGAQEQGYGEEFAALLGGGFADGVNSGTNAVYVAFRALEVEPFTEVIVPPITDQGGTMPIVLAGCIPVPADAAPGSYNTGPEQVEARLTERTSAIVIAHISGLPVDMDPIMEIARARGIPVLEDCAQAHCATYKGRPVGTLGDVAAFSTMFGKHHATGGQGGVVFTRDEEMFWRIRRYADRGKPFNVDASGGNVVAALNCNMDELHAAIGRVQLKKLPGIVQRRRQAALALAQRCRETLQAVRVVTEAPDCEGVYWFLFLRLATDKLRVDKATFAQAVAAEGVPVDAGYRHIPTQAAWCRQRRVFGSSGMPWTSPLYQGDPDQEYPLPNVEASEACHVRASIHEGWTEREVDDFAAALAKVEKAYLA